uniref:non-specific serine/threonine protein kinase n=1 Tax=Culicoides sonorensis TaxID=179676 RepID=A0A336K9G6_CULSO
MSFRLLSTRLFKHGRILIQHYCKRDIQTKIFEQHKINNVQGNLRKAEGLVQQHLKSQGIFRFGQNARRLFVDNILNRVTNPYSAELRSQATKKFLYGDSTPFFALVGVSLASGAGLLTKDDELEGVCYEIREAVTRFQQNWAEKDLNENFASDLSLNSLDIGPPIAKGCSAVVYAAKFKEEKIDDNPVEVPGAKQTFYEQTGETLLSPVQNISRFIHNFGGSVDNVFEHNFDRSHTLSQISGQGLASPDGSVQMKTPNSELSDQSQRVRFASRVSRYSITSWNSNDNITSDHESELEYETSILEFPLALKVMFNYDIESNAMSILKAMHKETVPTRRRNIEEASEWEKSLLRETIFLPPHPNIVAIYGVFCDRIPKLKHASKLYPMALPPRLNPQGYGRNMSLFLLMKRYDLSLREFLHQLDMNMRDRVVIFTQLLEAITHLNRHGVAHRDLKSDNILVEFNEDSAPTLVLSDFGCCIADKNHCLRIPYSSSEIDKGGNTALMAPEIISKVPGAFSILDYSKSDLWACGTIAYEIFGQQNPFYCSSNASSVALKNLNYSVEELPQMNDEVPFIVRKLIADILQPNHRKRVSTDIAANIMQLYLWAPSRWLKVGSNPSSNEILQWLLSLTTKTLCEGRSNIETNFNKSGRRTYTEYLLISSFLSRVRLSRIRVALNWIQTVIQDKFAFDL